jgi:hypothetical protein
MITGRSKTMKTRLKIMLSVVAICLTIYVAASIIGTKDGFPVSPAYAASEVTAKEATIDGSSVGEVFVGNDVVFRIRTSAGGYSPFQRAQLVAGRLQPLMDNLQLKDITTGRMNGQEVVMAKGQLIITADTAHAGLNQTTPTILADLWATNLKNAVSGNPVTAETPVSQKVVPIISAGQGTRIGGALVAGAKSKLDEVVAVAQLEGQFGDSVRVKILVPVSSQDVVKDIRRVPETSVIGLVDISL